MTQDDATAWDARYEQGFGPVAGRAALRLAPYAEQIAAAANAARASGRVPEALDLACGAGGTVLWLALRGWQVTGVDVSKVALELAASACAVGGVGDRCRLIEADLDFWRPVPASTDLLCSFYYLNRGLWPAMRAAVRPGGLIVVETFNQHRLASRPQANPAFLLAEGELLGEIERWGWTVLAYHSHGRHVSRPTDAVLARRPAD